MQDMLENTVVTNGHRSFFLSSGPDDGPAMILVHGWPELGLSWRHVMQHFGAMGFRVIAPDMRGYGRSDVYDRYDAYAQRHVVADMIGLADALGIGRAVWVGHDWGTATVWSIASHHPDRCHGVANLCVPYRTLEFGLAGLVPLVDRNIYPEDSAPFGQWAYQKFYHDHFERATKVFDAAPERMVRAMFRRGNPEALGAPSPHIHIPANNGWFGGADCAPDVAHDPAVISRAELSVYAEALSRNGFFGPDSYYMNDAANAAYTDEALKGGHLDMPVLFLAGRYDITCEAVDSRLAEPMRAHCSDLTEAVVLSGHWMAQERPDRVNAELSRWLAARLPQIWPQDNALA